MRRWPRCETNCRPVEPGCGGSHVSLVGLVAIREATTPVQRNVEVLASFADLASIVFVMVFHMTFHDRKGEARERPVATTAVPEPFLAKFAFVSSIKFLP